MRWLAYIPGLNSLPVVCNYTSQALQKQHRRMHRELQLESKALVAGAREIDQKIQDIKRKMTQCYTAIIRQGGNPAHWRNTEYRAEVTMLEGELKLEQTKLNSAFTNLAYYTSETTDNEITRQDQHTWNVLRKNNILKEMMGQSFNKGFLKFVKDMEKKRESQMEEEINRADAQFTADIEREDHNLTMAVLTEEHSKALTGGGHSLADQILKDMHVQLPPKWQAGEDGDGDGGEVVDELKEFSTTTKTLTDAYLSDVEEMS